MFSDAVFFRYLLPAKLYNFVIIWVANEIRMV